MVGCKPKGTPENQAKLVELETVLDSVQTILEPLPDVVVFDELSKKMTAQYRFFYDNFADLEHSDTLLEWLSGLEASRKFVTRFANEGDGLKAALADAKKQVTTLKHDYSKGLITDSLFEVYYLQEAAAVEALMKNTQKKAAPLDYYLGVMNQIKNPLDSAMFYYQNKLNLWKSCCRCFLPSLLR